MSKEEMKNRKEEIYRKILDTSWDIAIAEGMDALSIRKVATALHFAPNNIYNYFQNKSELLYQLKKDAYEWTLEVIFKDFPEFETSWELINYVSRNLMFVALQEPERYIVMTSDMIMDSEDPLDIKINDMVAQIIVRGIESGEFRQLDAQTTARNIRIAMIAFIRWISSQKKMTKEQANCYLENLLSILYGGLKAEKDRKK